MPRKNANSRKKEVPVYEEGKGSSKEVQDARKDGKEAGGEKRVSVIFRDRFDAFRHFGVGSMEQLAEKLGKSYHGESLEELLNG